jgi:tRNA (cmo5U34)-methyltransferase
MTLEEMGDFFNSRIDTYEDHMLESCNGESKYYTEIAGLVPATPDLKLLDLGCGTGLELDAIFKVNPAVQVTGIDLAEKLLEKLSEKHADRKSQLNLILADYFEYDFGENIYDVALSVQTLHHFSYEAKIRMYKKILRSLKPSGFYIESDYMALDQEFEDFHFAEAKRIRSEEGKTEGYYHYDTPCTVENQVALLKKAGFSTVEIVSRRNNSVTLIARK